MKWKNNNKQQQAALEHIFFFFDTRVCYIVNILQVYYVPADTRHTVHTVHTLLFEHNKSFTLTIYACIVCCTVE